MTIHYYKCGCIEEHIGDFIPFINVLNECKKHKEANKQFMNDMIEAQKNGKLYPDKTYKKIPKIEVRKNE